MFSADYKYFPHLISITVHPVYYCPFPFFYLSPLLLIIALAGPVRPADKRHLAEKKVS